MADGQGLAGGGGQPVVASGQAPQGVDQQAVVQALQQAIQASVDEQGFVDVKKLATIWPQIAQQVGVNIPFETVLQMIQSSPELIQDMLIEMGLAGISIDGRQISAEELAGIGSGATGVPGGQVPAQGGV